MDKLSSGNCYFLDRKVPGTLDTPDDDPWKRLDLPTTKKRDLSPTTKNPEQLNDDWTIRTKETMEEKNIIKLNGSVNLYRNNELQGIDGQLNIRSFKETTV